MSLTGAPLVVLLGLLALALPVLCVVLWLRPRPARAPARRRRAVGVAAVAVGAQLAAVLVVAAVANDYGDFYASWSELLGRAPTVAQGPAPAGRPSGTGVLAASGRTPSGTTSGAPGAAGAADPRAGRVVAGADFAWAPAAQWPTRGRIEQVTVTGARTGLSVHALVYLPPQWFAPGADRRTFPAALVMTGYPGHAENLVRRMQYPQHLLAETAAGKAQPMVLVLVSPSVVMPRDTECTDVYGGPQVETFLGVDLPAALEPVYRLRPGDWGAVGDSTGGWCAVKLAMDHWTTFPAAVSLSGYYHPLSDSTTGSLWGGSQQLKDLNDPRWRLQHLPPPPVSVFATSSHGEKGPNGYKDLQTFATLVRPPMHLDTEILASGGHNFTTWSVELPTAFDWLSAHLAAVGTPPGTA